MVFTEIQRDFIPEINKHTDKTQVHGNAGDFFIIAPLMFRSKNNLISVIRF